MFDRSGTVGEATEEEVLVGETRPLAAETPDRICGCSALRGPSVCTGGSGGAATVGRDDGGGTASRCSVGAVGTGDTTPPSAPLRVTVVRFVTVLRFGERDTTS